MKVGTWVVVREAGYYISKPGSYGKIVGFDGPGDRLLIRFEHFSCSKSILLEVFDTCDMDRLTERDRILAIRPTSLLEVKSEAEARKFVAKANL